MPIKRQEGEFDILYWSAFEPTDGTDPKQDPANYDRVGLVADLDDDLTNEAQSTTDRASSTHQSVIYGTQSSGVSIVCNTVETRDAGGSLTGDPTANSGTAGDKTLTIATDADDTISVSDGDMISLGSHSYHYLIRSTLDLGNSTSGSVDIAPRLQADIGGGNVVSLKTTGEDPVQLVLRDAAINQNEGWWLIHPEDGDGNAQTGLEGGHGRAIVEDFNYTRNAGDFKQFELSLTNKDTPSFFTV